MVSVKIIFESLRYTLCTTLESFNLVVHTELAPDIGLVQIRCDVWSFCSSNKSKLTDSEEAGGDYRPVRIG